MHPVGSGPSSRRDRLPPCPPIHCVGGIFDAIARQALGNPGQILSVGDGKPLRLISIAGLTTAVSVTTTWLILTGVRSSRATIILIAASLGSWIGALVATRTLDSREFLVAHPLAGPWHALHLTTSPSLTVDAPTWLYILSAVVWTTVIVATAATRIRRP